MLEEHDSITLMQQQANKSIVDALYHRGFINQKARDTALELLYPHLSWGEFSAQLLNILGFLFIVSGLIFYFAFNWENMSPSYKLQTIQAGLLCTVAGSWAFSLQKLSGQLFLCGASILVGVFLAVFGQIYQTGADSYQLFGFWALLILPWVLISRFAALWYLWFVIINVGIFFYWTEVANISTMRNILIFPLLILLNCLFLSLREYGDMRNLSWCQGRWHRILLTLSIVVLTMFPIMSFILDYKEWPNSYLTLSALLGLFVQFGFIYYYRAKKSDMWVISITMIALCIITCTAGFKILDVHINNEVFRWLLMSVLTLAVFTVGACILRKLTPTKETVYEKL